VAGRMRQQYIRGWIDDHRDTNKDPATGLQRESRLDYVCARLSNGEFLEDIAAEIQRDTLVEIPQHSLRRWLIDEFGKPEVMERFGEARKDAADAHVAKAWQILEDAPEVREALVKAKHKADLRIWMAERANRERYGPASAQALNVTVNIAQLHASALRARTIASPASIAPALVSQLAAPVEDAEVLLTEVLDSAAEA